LVKKNQWTYFNDDLKHRKVDEFCVWYLHGNSEKVETRKQTYVDATEYRMSLEPQHPARYKTAEERAYWESRAVDLQREIRKFSPNEKTSIMVPDERFKDLNPLVHRYAGIEKADNENREALVQELWRLIMLLEEEKRIEGDGYRMEPFHEIEMQGLSARMSLLERRLDSMVKFLGENNATFVRSWKDPARPVQP